MSVARVEKLFDKIAKATIRDVRVNKQPFVQSVTKNWESARAALVAKAPKDIFNLAKPDVQAKVAAVIKQHNLPADYANVPVMARGINSSIRAFPQRNVGLIHIMDVVKDLATKGEHKVWSYKKYATKNGLDDDMAAIVGRKGIEKIGDNAYVTNIGPGRWGRIFRLSDTESLSMVHIKLPEPVQKIMQGVRSIIEGFSRLRGAASSLKTA